MTPELFAQVTGLDVGVVRGMVDRKQLPTTKPGKRRMINVAAITAKCLQDAGINLEIDHQAE